MKVIEQLVQHLSEVGALSAAEVAWLREQGFLPRLDGEADDTSSDEAGADYDRPASEGLLEELQEKRIQEDLRAGRAPAKGSRGARRKRGRIADHRNAGKQRRTLRRIEVAGRTMSNADSQAVVSAVPALVAGIDHDDDDVVAAAQGVLRKLALRGAALIDGLLGEVRPSERRRRCLLQRAIVLCRIGAKCHVVENEMGMKFLRIPAGSYIEGSTTYVPSRGRRGDANVVRMTKGFYLGIEPVTTAQWNDVMGTEVSTGYFLTAPDEAKLGIVWNDAAEFCRKLARRERLNYQLPTEAQWEYGRRYALLTGIRKARLVGNHLSDGSSWEWCRDWFREPNSLAGIDPQGPTTGTFKVLRHGGYFVFAEGASESRQAGVPNSLGCGHTFRVCLEI